MMRPNTASDSQEPAHPVAARLLRIAWTVNRSCARTRHGAARRTIRLLADMDWRATVAEPGARAVRERLLTGLSAQWSHRRPERFEAAVQEAVVYDEFTLLPRDQRELLHDLVVNRRPLHEVATETARDPVELAALVHQALATLSSARAEISSQTASDGWRSLRRTGHRS